MGDTEAVQRMLQAWPGTQRELARLSGVHQSTLSLIQSGQLGASDDVESDIRRVLESTIHRLQEAIENG